MYEQFCVASFCCCIFNHLFVSFGWCGCCSIFFLSFFRLYHFRIIHSLLCAILCKVHQPIAKCLVLVFRKLLLVIPDCTTKLDTIASIIVFDQNFQIVKTFGATINCVFFKTNQTNINIFHRKFCRLQLVHQKKKYACCSLNLFSSSYHLIWFNE